MFSRIRRIKGKIRLYALLFAVLGVTLSAQAQTISGVVKNGTTGKPAPREEVILRSFTQGGREIARAKTDSGGRFHLNWPADTGPGLLSILHTGVWYFNPAIPGAKLVTVTVYDRATHVKGITTALDALRLEATSRELRVVELIAVKNESQPPRTQSDEAAYDLSLPAGARLQSVTANIGAVPPLSIEPVSAGRDRYHVNFAFRPGRTQLLVVYQLPYVGRTTMTVRPLHAVRQLVIALPHTMGFSSPGSPKFRSFQLKSGDSVEIAEDIQPGTPVTVTLSGWGTFSKAKADGGITGPRELAAGLPVPQRRWNSEDGLGIVVAALACCALVIMLKRRRASANSLTSATQQPLVRSTAPQASTLVEQLKSDFLELELRREVGTVSRDEYEIARAELDGRLKTALGAGKLDCSVAFSCAPQS